MSEEFTDDPVEMLVVSLLELPAAERKAAMEDLCEEHTAMASVLRQRMAALSSWGMDEGPPLLTARSRLQAGARLLHFELLAPLGAGGMGEVFLARDTRLEREVAIKALPEELAAHPMRMKRFEREARVLATLNHPNIAQIHGVENEAGRTILVLEYVDGEDLSTRIARGALPLAEAFELCAQIAAGLEAAHEAGVMHRDLKPANVRITAGGVAKLLDFGLAKSKPQADAPVQGQKDSKDSVSLTRDGYFLGTPVYMSPEQARGRKVDRRADIWAFGCILFECLTGKRAFSGDNYGDLSAAILEREPDWGALPRRLPDPVATLLHRCLEKDPMRRLRDAGEARIALEDARTGNAPTKKPAAATRELAAWLAFAAVSAVGLIAWWFGLGGSTAAVPVPMLSVHLPPDAPLDSATYTNLGLSRDGAQLVWIGGQEQQIYLRSLDDFSVRVLPGTHGSSSPCFSPDGAWIAFFQGDQLKKISVAGTTAELLVNEADHRDTISFFETENRGGTWSEDGWIYFCPSIVDGLFRVRPSGGAIERITEIEKSAEERTHRWPHAVAGGRAVLFTNDDARSPEQYDDASIWAVLPNSRERRLVLAGASQARSSGGSLVYARGGSLLRASFHGAELRVSGDERLLEHEVQRDVSSGSAQFSVAEDGSLAFAPSQPLDRALRLAWQHQDGTTEPLPLEAGAYSEPALSPDGRKIAVIVSNAGTTDVWVHDLERKTIRRLTRNGSCFAPVWSPDGARIAYLSRDPSGLFVRAADGTGEAECLLATGEDWATPCWYSPDGSRILFDWRREGSRNDLVFLDLATKQCSDAVATVAVEGQPAVSPDRAWLAYTSDASGTEEVYLQALTGGGKRWPVSGNGGSEPSWSEDGGTLYYVRGLDRQLWSVAFTSGAEPQLGAPQLALENFFHYSPAARRNYARGSGGRFLTIVADDRQREVGREIRLEQRRLTAH